MINFLSQTSWIAPQIDFLVFLQNIRTEHFEYLNKLFLSLTMFGEFWIPTLFCAIYYWCFDSKKGLYVFSVFGLNVIFAHLFKMIACVYRPWVLSDRVKPVQDAIFFAKGYSFPSGHSATSSSVFGAFAFVFRKYKIAVAALILLILSVGFSRMWVGVHTPQDVICGFLLGIILIFLVSKVVDWADADKNRYLYIMAVIDIFAVASLIYVCCINQYPLDYIDGKLLVDPHNAIHSVVVCYAIALGLINGILLCTRFFPFEPKNVPVKNRVLRGFIGIILLTVLLNGAFESCFAGDCSFKQAFAVAFTCGLFITAIYPLIFTKLNKFI